MTEPCDQCPYLIGSGFTWDSLEAHASGEFPCHKACDIDEEEGVFVERNNDTPHCAGALIFLELQDRPHQMMRICERLGFYDRTKLNMKARVVRKPQDTTDQLREMHVIMNTKLTTDQLREAHVRMKGQAETGRKIKDAIMKRQNDTGRCSYCGKPSQGNFTIHRDGYCEGPEVPLCDECGDSNGPNLEEIWRKLALNRKSSHPIMDESDEIARLKARIAELETDNLNLIDQLRGPPLPPNAP